MRVAIDGQVIEVLAGTLAGHGHAQGGDAEYAEPLEVLEKARKGSKKD